jgi:hypothetical protein
MLSLRIRVKNSHRDNQNYRTEILDNIFQCMYSINLTKDQGQNWKGWKEEKHVGNLKKMHISYDIYYMFSLFRICGTL